jgi:hypothetical protein
MNHMEEHVVARFTSPDGLLAVELARTSETPEGCLTYRRLLFGEVMTQRLIAESQANGVRARLVAEGWRATEAATR